MNRQSSLENDEGGNRDGLSTPPRLHSPETGIASQNGSVRDGTLGGENEDRRGSEESQPLLSTRTNPTLPRLKTPIPVYSAPFSSSMPNPAGSSRHPLVESSSNSSSFSSSYRDARGDLSVNTRPTRDRNTPPLDRIAKRTTERARFLSRDEELAMMAAQLNEMQNTYLLHSPTAGQLDFAYLPTPLTLSSSVSSSSDRFLAPSYSSSSERGLSGLSSKGVLGPTPTSTTSNGIQAGPGRAMGKRHLRHYSSSNIYGAAADDPRTPLSGPGAYAKGKIQYCDMYHSKYLPVQPKGWAAIWPFFESPALLITIGIMSAIQATLIDFLVTTSHAILEQIDGVDPMLGIFYSCSSAALACAIVHFCPQAGGSGMPEMKVVLSGIINRSYLTVRTFMLKSIGLVLAFCGDLSIGREGPFVQIACGIADSLMQLRCFSRIRENASKRLEILACASAVGVSATFGTPFGGILFSIEVTAHFYMIRNLPRAFFAAICGAVMVILMGKQGQLALFNTVWRDNSLKASIEITRDHVGDLVASVILGSIAGLFGVLFIFLVEYLIIFRNYILSRDASFWIGGGSGKAIIARKFILVITVTFLVNVMYRYSHYSLFLYGTQKTITDYIFHDELFDEPNIIYKPLFVFFPLKMIFTALCITLPIPAGLFTPTFLAGGAFGRCFGEVMLRYFPEFSTLQPWEFALIGACAYASGVTRAISTAVIVLELTGHTYLSIYAGIAIVCAYFIGNRFTVNVYDHLVMANDLPRLPYLPKKAYDIPSWEVMREVSKMKFITLSTTYLEAKILLEENKNEVVFPIVQSEDDMLLLGAVMRSELSAAVKALASATRMFARLQRHPSMRHELMATQSKTQHWEWAKLAAENASIHDLVLFAFNRGGRFYNLKTLQEIELNEHFVAMDAAPFQIVEAMPLIKVDLLFRMLKLKEAYVTRQGRLVGVISRNRLQNFLLTISDPKSSLTSSILAQLKFYIVSPIAHLISRARPKRREYTRL